MRVWSWVVAGALAVVAAVLYFVGQRKAASMQLNLVRAKLVEPEVRALRKEANRRLEANEAITYDLRQKIKEREDALVHLYESAGMAEEPIHERMWKLRK
jgi:hypothetical protein